MRKIVQIERYELTCFGDAFASCLFSYSYSLNTILGHCTIECIMPSTYVEYVISSVLLIRRVQSRCHPDRSWPPNRFFIVHWSRLLLLQVLLSPVWRQ